MIRNLVFGLLAVFLLAGEATAAPFAQQSYFAGFIDHWKTTAGKQNTIVVGVLLAGAAGIFIITRGRKR